MKRRSQERRFRLRRREECLPSAVIQSFPPLVGSKPQVLVLGSMPGEASLRAHMYYAHPRNLFWPLMAALHGFSAHAPYEVRCEALMGAGVALWDVLASCRRSGSLDTAIDRDSEVANDIAALVRAQPSLRGILLNGAKAATSLRRHHPALPIPCIALPSTSPANAGMSRAAKESAWAAAFSATRTVAPPG